MNKQMEMGNCGRNLDIRESMDRHLHQKSEDIPKKMLAAPFVTRVEHGCSHHFNEDALTSYQVQSGCKSNFYKYV